MKRLFILAISVFAFSCGGDSDQNQEQGVDETNSPENVDNYSGENITPQVDLDSDSTQRLEVDTISSPQGERREDQ